MRRVYFDHNATSPIHPDVKQVIVDNLEEYGNASSPYTIGRGVRKKIEAVRSHIRDFLGDSDGELVFTSGGSESNNLILKGLTCRGAVCRNPEARVGNHLIISQIEHPSVLETCHCLETMGYSVTALPVDQYGLVKPADLERAINPNTALVSIMAANNEIGTIQPLKDLAAIAHQRGTFFHTDAVQAVGKIPIDVKEMGIDFLSLSGHKLNAPKGIGGLYARSGIGLCPLIHGGHQEKSWRAGTENTLGILALGKAIELAQAHMAEEFERVSRLRDRLEKGLLAAVPEIMVNGHTTQRLPGTTNITFKYIEGESILFRLDAAGIAVSTGSACSTGSLEPSHVLRAIGLPHELCHGSIRFSLGFGNTEEDVDYALEVIPEIVAGLREISPLHARQEEG